MARIFLLFSFFLLIQISIIAQKPDNEVVESFFREALTDTTAYGNLRYLCKNFSGRITGSPQAAGAVEFTYQVMRNMNIGPVFKQPVEVPHWVRGEAEKAAIQSGKFGFREVPVLALGMSIGTGDPGLSAHVVEVNDFDELKKMGR
ncbi:MAG: peptidase M28 family protein, partial [Bacteroidia bacterium]|nr:peptidase M28 family protein [Bacteroidia bacterium]